MSIVTNVLNKLGLTGTVNRKINCFAPKLNIQFSQILWKNLRLGREWPSTRRSEEFQREKMARRAINEMQGRLQLAR
jgi:hypothetical protein